jgi:hypothetical protein
MRNGSLSRCAIALFGLAVGFGLDKATAQIAAPEAPTYKVTDINDVDLLSGTVYAKLTDLRIGTDKHSLIHTSYVAGPPAPGDSFTGYL